jgi:hypothetical protein
LAIAEKATMSQLFLEVWVVKGTRGGCHRFTEIEDNYLLATKIARTGGVGDDKHGLALYFRL